MRKSWRHVALYLTIVGMEVSWLYIWVAFLSNSLTDGGLSPFGLLSLYGLSFGVNKLFSRRKLSWRYSLTLNILLWLVSLLVIIKIQLYANLGLLSKEFLLRAFGFGGFKPEMLAFLISITLWVLGFRLAKTKTGFSLAVTEFQIGLVFLLIAFLLSSQMKAGITNSLLISLAFVCFALLGVAIAHGEQGNSWLTVRNHGYWIVLLLIVILVVIVLGLIIGAFVTPEILELMTTPFKLLWGLIVRVMTFIAHFSFWDKLMGQPVRELTGPERTIRPETPEEGLGVFQLSQSLRNRLRFIMSTAWIIVILLAIWRLFSVIFNWLRLRAQATSGVEMESLNGAFKEDFFAFLRRILRWLFQCLKVLFLRRQMLHSAFPEVATVRDIYRQLLSWAASKGWSRAYAQTPYEYLYTLETALPLFQEDLFFITTQYVRARYGSSRPNEAELDEMRKRWRKVRQGEEKPRK